MRDMRSLGALDHPSFVSLTVSLQREEQDCWSAAYQAFSSQLPVLRTLTLVGRPVRLSQWLSQLPDSLVHLRLVIAFSVPGAPGGASEDQIPGEPGYPGTDETPGGSLHRWQITAALRRGLKICTQTSRPPQLTLLTGLEDPIGWRSAVRIVTETGVCLTREIDTATTRRARTWHHPKRRAS